MIKMPKKCEYVRFKNYGKKSPFMIYAYFRARRRWKAINVMKKHCNKELVMTKKDDEDFENSNRCWVCDGDYSDGVVKVRDHCHITGKYRVSLCIEIVISRLYEIIKFLLYSTT